jgi:hypothetical protein
MTRLALRKFIYHPVVLASLDQDYFGKLAVDPPAFPGDQDDREAAAAAVPLAARDFESAVRAAGEELLYLVGIPGVARAIAEQHHAPFQVARLPGVEEAIGGGQRKWIARIFGSGRGGMRMMRCRQRPKREEQEPESRPSKIRAAAVIRGGIGRKSPLQIHAFLDIASQSASQIWRTSPLFKEPTIVLGGRLLFKG